MSAARFTVPVSHPALPGHFPGRPIVPGVLLLDAVIEAACASHTPGPTHLLRAKFPAPVAPGVEVEITLVPQGPDRVAFTCRSGGVTVLVGELGWPTPP